MNEHAHYQSHMAVQRRFFSVFLCVVLALLSPVLGAEDGQSDKAVAEVKAAMQHFMEAEILPLSQMDSVQLQAVLDTPVPQQMQLNYVDKVRGRRNGAHLALAGGWMRSAAEDVLVKTGPFESMSVALWGEAAKKVAAFSVLLEKDSKAAISWLGTFKDEKSPTYLQAAYLGMCYASIPGEDASTGKWKWEASTREWKSFLGVQNPLLRSLALNFVDRFATPEEVSVACSEEMDTEYSYLHELAIEKLARLGHPAAEAVLKRYVTGNKASRAGEKAETMRQKAQDALNRLKTDQRATGVNNQESD